MVTPEKYDENAELHNKHITVGRWVQYDSGRVQRQGKVTQILRTTDETPHPPKVVYEVQTEKGEIKEYTNNPSKLTVITHK